jgi:septal ring factor EnvC (AmiA/AmiB activator)
MTIASLIHSRRLALVLFAFCGVALHDGYAVDAQAPAQRETARRALETMKARVGALQQELAAGEAAEGDAALALRESERAISDATRALSELATRQAALEPELARRRSELADLVREQAAGQARLRRLLREQYRSRGSDPLALLLTGEDPAVVRRQYRYLAALGEARLAAFAEARRRMERQRALEADLALQVQELGGLAAAAATDRATLEAQRGKRARTLAAIGSDLAARRRELATLAADERRLVRLLQRLETIAAPARETVGAPPAGHEQPPDAAPGPTRAEVTGGIGSTLRGALKLPAQGELVARFGVPRNGSGPAWKGWFIRAAGGTSVAAVAAGRVVFSDWLRGLGNLVIVDHGEGFMSLYGNNDALLQQVGEQVVAGQPIAQAGSSGGALESGVYFEWRHDGVALDPKEWFAREAIASSLNRSQ